MTDVDEHDPDRWHPDDILRPGPCPPHLKAALRQAIADGRARYEATLELIRQRSQQEDT